MTINGTDVSFDLDIRANANAFTKAYHVLQKRMLSRRISDIDIEQFLRTCLTKQVADTLLADNRITTLTKVFLDFFAQTIEQFRNITETYRTILESMEAMNKSADEIIKDYSAYMSSVDELQMTLPEE